jgi:ketosteroid isomerase-like protein
LILAAIQPGDAQARFLFGGKSSDKEAANKTAEAAVPVQSTVQNQLSAKDIAQLTQLVNQLLAASNRHDMEGVLKYYSPRFISGDNLSLDDISHLIKETWEMYPDIRYTSSVVAMRGNNGWATIETMDSATATAKADAGSANTAGRLKSESRGILYLRRMRDDHWEIVSDYTLSEQASILYGDAAKYPMSLSAPDQMFSGEPFSAQLKVDMPANIYAIATIAQTPLVYPQLKPEEKFRSLSEEKNILERVFEANSDHRNEIITATIGLTQLGQDELSRPSIQLKGIATLVKRVNVVPQAKPYESEASKLVRTSASGAIDLSKMPISKEPSPLSPDAAMEESQPDSSIDDETDGQTQPGEPAEEAAPPAQSQPGDKQPSGAPKNE